MAHELPLGRRVRIGARVAAGFIALALLVAVPAPALLRGARFGHLVVSLLPQTRGQVHIGGGRWSWGSVLALARGRAAPFVLDDVRVI